jgi:hypothetical protein
MKPDWRSDLSICAAGFTAERIGHNLRGESIYRNDIVIAVGTAITDRPPHRSVRARLRIRLF